MSKKRRRHTIKDKEARKLLLDVSEKLGTDIEQLLGYKTRIEVDETEIAKIFIINGRPLIAQSDGTLFFTLVFEEIFSLVPKIMVDMGAVPYVCKGADIMAPGILSIEGEFGQKNLLIVVDECHRKPLAVGISLFNSEEMKNLQKGKTVKILHYVGDKLWDQIKNY
jgi:PUA-domain protein